MNKPTVFLLALLSASFFVQTQAQNNIVDAIVRVETQKASGAARYYAPVNAGVIPQLQLTDEEAIAVCSPIAGETARETGYNKTCSAFYTCNEYNGPNYGIVYIRPTAGGTFWSTNNTLERATPEATCPANPCNTGIPTTDGQTCYSYTICVNGKLETRKCADRTSYSYSQARSNPSNPCVPDDTCSQVAAYNYTIISCTPLTSVQAPVVDYNRTQLIIFADGRPEERTLTLKCPANTVLDMRNLNNCTCIPSNQRDCPVVLERTASLTLGATNNVVAEFPALASNEIAGNFTMSFGFQVSGSTTSASLVSNSRNTMNCRTATLEVYLENGVIGARLVNINGGTFTLTTNNVISTGNTYTVQLMRSYRTVTLSVNGNQAATADIGTSRLAKTNCGLSLGRGYPRANFVGTIENFRMTLPCV
ncbi:uncharacterized protein LOC112564617 [Pomacea canaliculata]|uniref:uncharacterized protein LOC112564617 n=1 Tax=Pomacea canaliculata TaxID=400727 RepID=UPI000D732553|nr:uncharacterized protein LOC112564617 [Pomacea canaliculata]